MDPNPKRQHHPPQLPSIPPQKTLSCSLGDGRTIDIYCWAGLDTGQSADPVLIVHDLWEDLRFYDNDLRWLLAQKKRVYGINVYYDGTHPSQSFPDSYQKVCIYLMQVLARIRSVEDMRSPLIYTKGVGALVTIYIARKNAKFIRGMIAYAPMLFLDKAPAVWQQISIRLAMTLLPHMMLPRFCLPKITEFSQYAPVQGGGGDGKEDEEDEGEDEDGEETEVRSSVPKPVKSIVSVESSQRIRARAIYEYLRAMDRMKRMCARLRLPCLFICPEESAVHSYDYLGEVQERYEGVMNMEVLRTPLYEAVRSGRKAEDFAFFAKEKIVPWLVKLEQLEKEVGLVSTPDNNALPDDDLSTSLTSFGQTGP